MTDATPVTYRSAFISCARCGAPVTRVCYGGPIPDRYDCDNGCVPCKPGWDPRHPLPRPDDWLAAPLPRSVRDES